METVINKCLQCGWCGNGEETDGYWVDSCTGSNKVDMCPNSGSLELITDNKNRL